MVIDEAAERLGYRPKAVISPHANHEAIRIKRSCVRPIGGCVDNRGR